MAPNITIQLNNFTMISFDAMLTVLQLASYSNNHSVYQRNITGMLPQFRV